MGFMIHIDMYMYMYVYIYIYITRFCLTYTPCTQVMRELVKDHRGKPRLAPNAKIVKSVRTWDQAVADMEEHLRKEVCAQIYLAPCVLRSSLWKINMHS